MFNPNSKLDEEDEHDGPALVIGFGKPKKKPSFDPNEKLGGDEEDKPSMDSDAEARFGESCEIMAKMINLGRVDPVKFGKAFREAFQALENEPHAEHGHDEGAEEEGK